LNISAFEIVQLLEVFMSNMSKALLVASLTASVIGVLVSFTTIPFPPVWTVVMPFGAILYGLFLIHFVFGDHLFHSGGEDLTETHSAANRKSPPLDHDAMDHESVTPGQLAHG
jgi:hypothetical protein